MKKRIRALMPILVILAMLASMLGMAIPVMAATNSVNQSLSVDPSFTYADGTLHYYVFVQNNPLSGANDAVVDLVFYPPGPAGGATSLGAPVELANDLYLAVGESVLFTWVGGGGDVENAGLEVDLGAIPLDPGVTLVYGECQLHADYIADPPYAADDTKNIPAVIIYPCIDIEKTVDCNDDGVFLDEDTGIAGDTGHWRVVVTNCGDADLFDIIVTDDNGHDFGAPFDLPAGGVPVEFNYDTVVNEDTTNWAYVEGFDALGGVWTDEDAATNLVIIPCIDIEKTVDCNDDGIFLDEDTGIAGDTGHWKVVVTNCGDADLFDVLVTDDNGHDFGAPFDLPAGGAPVEFNYDTVVNEDTTNWAYVTGYDALGGIWYDEDDATNLVLQPCIDIEKTVDCNDDGVFLDEDTGTAGDTGHWRIVVTNCGTADLFDVTVWDTNGMSWGSFDLPAGDSVQYDYDTIVNETTTNWAYVEGYDAAGGIWYDEDDATNVVTGGEGCTPGYWKNNAKNWEASAWVGYAPGDSFEAIFGVDVTLRGNGKATYPTPTLLEALDANGGGINALARHAVAALLNISNPDIGYGIGSTAALITMVHDAIVSGDESQIDALHVLLAGYNEAGCPINQHGEPIIPDGIVV